MINISLQKQKSNFFSGRKYYSSSTFLFTKSTSTAGIDTYNWLAKNFKGEDLSNLETFKETVPAEKLKQAESVITESGQKIMEQKGKFDGMLNPPFNFPNNEAEVDITTFPSRFTTNSALRRLIRMGNDFELPYLDCDFGQVSSTLNLLLMLYANKPLFVYSASFLQLQYKSLGLKHVLIAKKNSNSIVLEGIPVDASQRLTKDIHCLGQVVQDSEMAKRAGISNDVFYNLQPLERELDRQYNQSMFEITPITDVSF